MTTTSDSSHSNAGDKTPRNRRYLPQLPASSCFSLLTGLLLLLAFCFLPWFDTYASCSVYTTSRYYTCEGGGAELQPAEPATGLLLASRGVSTRSITLSYPSKYDFYLPTHFPLVHPEQFHFPFLWLPFASSLVWLLLPCVRWTRKEKLTRRDVQVSLLVQLISLLVVLAFLILAFSAFPLAKAFISQMHLPDDLEQIEFSTHPTAGAFLVLLMEVAGSILYWWAYVEEKQPKPERFVCRLAHLEERERRGRVIKSSYSTFPLGIIVRPERGIRNTSLVCPRCHEELRFSVKSKPRLWWYRLGVMAMVVAIMELPFWLAGPTLSQNLEPVFTGLLVCGGCAFVVLLLFIGRKGIAVTPSKEHTIAATAFDGRGQKQGS